MGMQFYGRSASNIMLQWIERSSLNQDMAKELRDRTDDTQLVYAANEIQLKAPLRPRKIVAVLVNSQGMLGGEDIKLSHPRLFMKAPSAIIGPEETIQAPSSGIRPEVELGIVIGRRISKVDPSAAEQAIFGYTIFNDVTDPADSKEDAYPAYRRDSASGDLRKTTLRGPLFRSKNHDTFAPLGPWIVSRDEMKDVGDLKMRTRFNGQVIQEGSTSEYLFSPSEILAFISGFLTLEPGDIVAAGTIGWLNADGRALDPSEWILPSIDGAIELEIEGIGVLRNQVKLVE
jgi:2-keto-4-pentenoate hydratase/2-oxohepta-3-ene-1,7-dioic acid hydratase in catechol pathway